MRLFGRVQRLKYIAHALLLVGLVWLIVGANTTSTAAADMAITIQGFAFGPATITIPVGTTVTWTNKDTATHNVTSATGAFASKDMTTGQTFSFTFNQAGSFTYGCTIHPRMVATIVVSGSASATTANAPSGGASTTSVLPKTGETRDNRNGGMIAALLVAAAVIGAGAILRTRTGKG